MQRHIDWPVESGTPRRRRLGLIVLFVLALAVIFGGRTAVSYWVDLLWFRSLGYQEVFWKTIGLEWGVFALFFAATFVVLYCVFAILRRAHRDDLPRDQTILFGGRPVTFSLKPVLGFVGVAGPLLVALVTGGAMTSEWPTFALFRYAGPVAGGVTDPVFLKPIGFFLFTLPAWHLIAGWLVTLAVLSCGTALVFLLISGGTRVFGKDHDAYRESPWWGLSLAIAFLLLTMALRVWLSRFDLLLEHHTIFDGISYTDAHVQLAGKMVVCWALVLGAAIAAGGAIRRPRAIWLAHPYFRW
jgi:uncharacterized protein